MPTEQRRNRPQPLLLVPASPRNGWPASWQAGGLAVLSLILAAVALVAAPSLRGEQVAVSSERAGPVSPGPKEGQPEAERHIVKLLPDQKVLKGSPPTVIRLDHVFLDTEVGQENNELDLSVEYNKKRSVVDAQLERGNLILTWGEVGKGEIIVRAVNPHTRNYVDNKFFVEVWQPDYWKLVLTVIGGLGIFLLGMKSMSEGLQVVAGQGLRRMISAVTDNRLMATGVGVLVTTLVQSSTVTTVMVVGFVNSGFMTLAQGIGVIMGANIGTTITGWVLALKIGVYGLPIAGVGAFGYLFTRRDKWRYSAMALMGLGMIFLGLELMKDGFSLLKDLPTFETWFQVFQADTYWGVLKCALVGCVLTFVVQSSSATLGITIGLAQIGVIPFETAAALVMGENVGTTITAWLASLGATTNARRAAYFHVIFNLIGVAWITAVFQWYLPIVVLVVASLWGVDPDTQQIDPTNGIAVTHTGFNVINTLVFLPFAPLLARMLQRVVPDKGHKEKHHLTRLDVRMLETPLIAIEQSRIELLRMGDGCNKMMNWLKTIATSEVPDEQLVRKTFHREEVLDAIQDEIIIFLTDMLTGNVPHDMIDEGRRQLRMADEYESVSDYIVTILKSHLKLMEHGLRLPEYYQTRLLTLHDEVADYLRLVSQGYQQRQPEVITKANSRGEAITRHFKQLRQEFLDNMSQERVEPMVSMAFNAQLNAYRRVRDHVLNIAEALAGEK